MFVKINVFLTQFAYHIRPPVTPKPVVNRIDWVVVIRPGTKNNNNKMKQNQIDNNKALLTF